MTDTLQEGEQRWQNLWLALAQVKSHARCPVDGLKMAPGEEGLECDEGHVWPPDINAASMRAKLEEYGIATDAPPRRHARLDLRVMSQDDPNAVRLRFRPDTLLGRQAAELERAGLVREMAHALIDAGAPITDGLDCRYCNLNLSGRVATEPSEHLTTCVWARLKRVLLGYAPSWGGVEP